MSDRIRILNKLAESRFGGCKYAKAARAKLLNDMEENGVREGVVVECEKISTVALLTILGPGNQTDVRIISAGIISCANCRSFIEGV